MSSPAQDKPPDGPNASTTPQPNATSIKRDRQHSTRTPRSLRFTELHTTTTTTTTTSTNSFPWTSENTSEPTTPNITESLTSLRRTLSLTHLSTTLDTSLTPRPLSTHPSQIFDPEILRSALGTVASQTKGRVWRPEGERPHRPGDAERALVLSVRRAIRSGVLAYLLRAGINLLLLLLRGARRPRKYWTKNLIAHALFGQEPFRFGGMIGVFTGLNTLVLHVLRLGRMPRGLRIRWSRMVLRVREVLTGEVGRMDRPALDKAELGLGITLSDQPKNSPSQVSSTHDLQSDLQDENDGDREGGARQMKDSGERVWHAALAGAVGSLGLLCEGKERRVGVAQQLFVRGLQASYNISALSHPVLHLPHSLGPILIFGLCCGQIMFAFLLSPETIPREYNEWILAASGVQRGAVVVNRGLERGRRVVEEAVEKGLALKNITPHNRQELINLLERGKNGVIPDGVPCAIIHPWLDSCRAVQLERYFTTVRFMLPVYSALHFIPMLVLRSSHVRRDPLRMLAKAAWGTMRSSSFLAVFVMIYQGLLCFRTQLLEGYLGELPQALRRLLKRKQAFWMIGFMTCFSLFVEEKRRRAELAMYVLPKALESAWSSARKRAWVPLVPFGENLLGAAAMAMIMHAYKHEPQALSGLVRRVMYQIIGPA